MYFRNNRRMDRDHHSLTIAAEQASKNPNRTRDNFAHFGFWRDQGLSVRAATAVAAAGCQSPEEVRDLGWRFFLRQGNCGPRTVEELSDLVGGWPDARRKYVAWLRRVPVDLLIEELRRRGIAVGRRNAS